MTIWPPKITGQIFVGGQWVDITNRLYVRDDINISRGAQDEFSRPGPQSLTVTVNNRDGWFSPRNPVGPWYGQLGRNTPIRLFDWGNNIGAGEISRLPQRWDLSGLDVYVPLEAFGIRKRLGSGNSPIKSTLYRGITALSPAPVAYWPCEDDDNTTQIGSALTGGSPMQIVGSTFPDFASYTGLPASEPLLTLKTSYLDGLITPYTVPSPNKLQLRFVLVAPSPEIPDVTYVADIHNAGTAGLWRLMYRTGGALQLEVWSNAFAGGPDIYAGGPISFNVVGKKLWVSLEMTQNGANVDWAIKTLEPGQATGLFTSGTVNSKTIGMGTRVFIDPLKVCNGAVVGHINVQPTVTSLFALGSELNAFTGEAAARRIERLCAQEGIGFLAGGNLDDSPLMGPQRPKKLLDLLDEAADVDGGTLFEPRDDVGFVFTPLHALYNKTVDLALDYDSGHISDPFEPLDDDFPVVNDFTAKGTEGGSAREYLASGVLSVLPPSQGGIGRYDDEDTFNVNDPGQLGDIAAYKVGQGTIDKPRFTEVVIDARNPYIRNAHLDDLMEVAGVNSRITIANVRPEVVQDTVSLQCRGYKQTINADKNVIRFNCAPDDMLSPMQIGTAGAMKIDNDTTTLTGGTYSTTANSMQFASTGDLWSTSAADYPVDVLMAGEVVRVTAMAGAASPQTATVQRSINDVVKQQTNGTSVRLYRRPILGR